MRVVVLPQPTELVVTAVRSGGAEVVDLDAAPEGLVWLAPDDPAGLRAAVDRAPTLRWAQLPFAGVEAFVDAAALSPDVTWACAKGVYAEPTAEHALALALAGLRQLGQRARANRWGAQGGVTLFDAPVVVLGGGGIAETLIHLLTPFRAPVTVVRRDASTPVRGATRTVGMEQLDEALAEALVVVLALALTPETEHVIGAPQLAAMRSDAWLVNVARGRHVDTAALVDALQQQQIGGAALDVTDPEPLPAESPLWGLPNCLITPHTANPWRTAQPLLSTRITENVRRACNGEPLLGLVDLTRGY